MTGDYYVYEHRRASDGRVFYVGKGRKDRAWRKNRRNRHWQAICNKHGFHVVLLYEGLSHRAAISLEIAIIAAYGLENLCNITAGGEGCLGRPRTEDERRRIRDKLMGHSHNLTGWKHSDEAKAAISKATQGRRRGGAIKNFDPTVFHFIHSSGEVFSGTTKDLSDYIGKDTHIREMARGIRHSALGWKLQDHKTRMTQ